ncbi:cytochrome c biogenesis heme-transporting ATPase CcmA [Alteromonas sp. LMIT006]|uniref:cytochrome c biogenesis heme-transporting ATPase CcmA n=1 Tax=Alteromonadaceae TaxID=72275 RepID=UPI0020CA83FF|nr:cytochrome c biogenesis heme-transporting ATPase CcmA [Alteromonas sp. LMIT006]UTP72622.1 cytochrome c biogenesis heme-transporting ATPase CcmA [Alteromonas sp. LMIT006]
MLIAQSLTCVKQDRVLFSDLDVILRAGELVHLTGPNGAGKTSLLRILAGLAYPETGSVHINSADTYDVPLLYLGHKLAQNKHLSAIENLTYWAALQRVNPSVESLYNILAQYQLVGLEDLPTGQLSAGQQRRVSLARTELVQAPLWVLDEPYTSLDVTGVAFIQARVDEYVSHGGCVIMTSHQALSSSHQVRELALEYQI